MTEKLSYEAYKTALSEQIKKSVSKIEAAQLHVRPNEAVVKPWQQSLSASIASYAQAQGGASIPDVETLIVHPPKSTKLDWAPDYALPTFELARTLRQNPVELAKAITDAIDKAPFSRIETAGPYINMRLHDAQLVGGIQSILEQDEAYGQLNDGGQKTVIVEFSSPNVAKPFGINHLRSTVIGESLARLMEAAGYTVIRDNHLGDWGTQFGNLLAAHQEYAPDTDFASLSMDELTSLYVRFSQEKKESPRLVRLGQECFARLEAGDQELRDKWTAALAMSLEEFNAMYRRLGITFDTYIGEAYFNEAAKTLIDHLSETDVDGAVVFDTDTKAVYIDAEHPVVLRTQDGYCVYAARDLATIEFRQHTYAPERVLYVVGEEQASYFRSVFDLAAKIGFKKLPENSEMDLVHIGFGLLLDEHGKKLSTRKGTSGKLEDVIDQLDQRAFEETKKRNADMPNDVAWTIARKIAVGALIWNDLRTDRTSSVRFDIDRMLSLGGGSVIDILYSYTRSSSILQKLDVESAASTQMPPAFSTETEHQISLRLMEFDEVIRSAAQECAPHVLVAYLLELSQLHGRFYEESRVQGLEDQALAQLRINVHRAYMIVIRNGLKLLNIPISERL